MSVSDEQETPDAGCVAADARQRRSVAHGMKGENAGERESGWVLWVARGSGMGCEYGHVLHFTRFAPNENVFMNSSDY